MTDDFEAVLLEYDPLLRWVVQDYYLSGGAWEDLMQEARIGLWQAWQRYDPKKATSFRPFAALVVRRKVIEAVKTSTRCKQSPLRAYVPLVATEGTAAEPWTGDVADIVTTRCTITEALRGLSPLEAAASTLVSGFGYTLPEAGRMLGTTRKGVDNAVQRARRKVQSV